MKISRSFPAALAIAFTALGGRGVAIAQGTPDDKGTGSTPKGGAGLVVVAPKGEAPPPAASKAQDPRVIKYSAPVFPLEAQTAGIEAEVKLFLVINKTGQVTKATVAEPVGHGFDEAAVEAAMGLVFEPARNAAGDPVASKIGFRYAFTLKTKEPSPTGANNAPAAKVSESLSGLVLITGAEATLSGATITAKGASGEMAATADANGHFNLTLTPGTYEVTIKAAGFDPLVVSEIIETGTALEVKYRLAPTGGGLEVVVRGDKAPREVTKRTLDRREIDRIPGTNGDALKSLQNLPGVARPPAIAGLLIVRGSSPNDTRYYVDGIEVPIVYHFFGLSAVVPTEMLDKIDFYPGNFSTQFGRAMAGAVDIGLRSPKDDGKYHGLVQFDLIDGRALLEGPLPFLKDWNFIAAGRRSWVDAWLGPLLRSAGSAITEAPVYYDYQFIAEHDTPKSRLRVGFFGSDDGLKLLDNTPSPGEPAATGDFQIHTAFQRLTLRYENDLSTKENVYATAALGRDVAGFSLGPLFLNVTTQSIFARTEFTHHYGKGITLHAGFDGEGTMYDVDLRLPPLPRAGEPAGQPFSTQPPVEAKSTGSTISPAVYVEAEVNPDERSHIVPGIRLDYDNITQKAAFSPRINGRYDIIHEFPKTTAKAGAGIFHEPPQPQQAISPFGTPGLLPQRAIHYSLGIEQEITRELKLSVEGFYKQLDEIVVAHPSSSGSNNVYDNVGTGRVIGGEVFLKMTPRPESRFMGWVSYTLSRSTRIDGPGQPEHLFQYDQTHILTLIGSMRLGHGWEFGMRYRLVSGSLTTPNVCDPAQTACDPYRANALWNSSGVYTAIPFSGQNSERLPLFHALDMRIDKSWAFKSWKLSAYLDVQNVYNNANAEGISYNYNYTSRQYISGLPILPILGARVDF